MNLQQIRPGLLDYLRRRRFGGLQGVGQPQQPYGQQSYGQAQQPSYGQPYGSQDYGMPQTREPHPYGQPMGQSQQPSQGFGQGQPFGQMNGGGQDLQPLDRNPYSPTQGQGFNLQNMMRRKRPTYY